MPELFHVLSVAQALERLLPYILDLERAERVPIVDALDRVTAELRSPVDLPAFKRSTMDGIAARAADT
jgi:molybdopterin molybdotransferase